MPDSFRSITSPVFKKMLALSVVAAAGFLTAASESTSTSPAPSTEAHVSGSETAGLIGARAVTIDGTIHRLGLEDGLAPVALVFLDPSCPISSRFVPRLNELSTVARQHAVRFYGVISDPTVGWREAATFRDEYQIDFPILFDASGDLASRLRPTTVPEAFVINGSDQVMYRGRIDDRFAAIGKLRSQVSRHDLLDALTAVAAGIASEPITTQAVGCVFEAWPSDSPQQVNYTRHVAPILQANCVECHQEGGIGPFPLDTYAHASRHSQMVSYVVKSRLMPPWRAAPNFGQFRDQRLLSQHEIDTLVAWAQGGDLEGDPADLLPFEAPTPAGWRLGEPDLVLTMAEPFEVPAAGSDVYRYFVLPGNLGGDREVVAIDFQPGDPSVVHHANIFVDYGGRGRELDARDPEPGFSVFGTGGFMSYDDAGAIGGWAPGAEPFQLPKGMGMGLPGGGDIVVEVHYHLTGKKTRDQSAVAFYFADEPVQRYVDGFVIGSQSVDIPAGEKAYQRHVQMQIPAGITLTDLTPHMHYLGREARAVATLPDGTELPLIHIPEWDLRWQNIYTFREPIHLPAGSRIDAWFSYDNSASNPSNPHRPPKRIQWGWGSDEEMCELWVTFVPDNPRDRDEIIQASRRSWMVPADGSMAEPLTTQVADPTSPDAAWTVLKRTGLWTAEATAVLDLAWVEDELASLLKYARVTANQNKKDADAQAVYAGLLSIKTFYGSAQNLAYVRWTQSERAYNRALNLDPDHWEARLGKGILYLYSEDADLLPRAGRILTDLIDLQSQSPRRPQHARTYFYLGEFYRLTGKLDRARDIWKKAATIFPTDHELAAIVTANS